MDKKKLILIILKFVPFLIGIVMYGVGIINLISSLLLFVGGYITVKNLFDYRMVRRNLNNILGNRCFDGKISMSMENTYDMVKNIDNDKNKKYDMANNSDTFLEEKSGKVRIKKRLR